MTDETESLDMRLRKFPQFWLNGATWVMGTRPEPLCVEAADRIAALEAERDRLREALRQFVVGLEDGFFYCYYCERHWPEGGVERHNLGCPAALPESKP